MSPASTLVTSMTSCLVCANIKCLVHRRKEALQLCSGCSGVAYCGEKCQEDGWRVHRVVCSKMKGVTWEVRVKLVKAMISLAREEVSEDQSFPTPGISGNDDEDDEQGEISTQPDSPSASTTGSPPIQARPDLPWDVSLSPVREAPGTIRTFCLVRFSCLSPITWKREVDVVKVKVWQDLELTSIGVFLPCEEDEEKLKMAFKIFSNGGELIYEQEEDIQELFSTDLDKMGELKLTDPIKLLAHRRYYLVVKMGGVACSDTSEVEVLDVVEAKATVEKDHIPDSGKEAPRLRIRRSLTMLIS
jgi:hypothetical protein